MDGSDVAFNTPFHGPIAVLQVVLHMVFLDMQKNSVHFLTEIVFLSTGLRLRLSADRWKKQTRKITQKRPTRYIEIETAIAAAQKKTLIRILEIHRLYKFKSIKVHFFLIVELYYSIQLTMANYPKIHIRVLVLIKTYSYFLVVNFGHFSPFFEPSIVMAKFVHMFTIRFDTLRSSPARSPRSAHSTDHSKSHQESIVRIPCHQLLKYLNTLSYTCILKTTKHNGRNLPSTQYTQDQLLTHERQKDHPLQCSFPSKLELSIFRSFLQILIICFGSSGHPAIVETAEALRLAYPGGVTPQRFNGIRLGLSYHNFLANHRFRYLKILKILFPNILIIQL
ncbi:hypothetical protein AGLY_004414 [Aphis glycines]|uniref:Uncharacterized protein n=1 Tax=Aphis glycines TaxID=307491 RepID=A0A6G0TXZ6_APHGL|nr:hypothetical protein AGLY_004414 [Aphis glycines]